MSSVIETQPSVATGVPAMSNRPILRLHDMFGCSVGDWLIVQCLSFLYLLVGTYMFENGKYNTSEIAITL